jgi:hypothetical protein
MTVICTGGGVDLGACVIVGEGSNAVGVAVKTITSFLIGVSVGKTIARVDVAVLIGGAIQVCVAVGAMFLIAIGRVGVSVAARDVGDGVNVEIETRDESSGADNSSGEVDCSTEQATSTSPASRMKCLNIVPPTKQPRLIFPTLGNHYNTICKIVNSASE